MLLQENHVLCLLNTVNAFILLQGSWPLSSWEKSVNAKSLVQKNVLSKTTAELHKEFTRFTNLDFSCSLGIFRKLLPQECITVQRICFNHSLCETCVNIELLLSPLRSVASSVGMEPRAYLFNDKYDILENTLCPKETGAHHKKLCIELECHACKNKLQDLLKEFKRDYFENLKSQQMFFVDSFFFQVIYSVLVVHSPFLLWHLYSLINSH